MSDPLYQLLTRDPASGGELIVTRLECPTSGVVIEGRFSLGWVGRLTPEQLDFVGLLLKHRNNLQKLAGEMGVAYNTARSRFDDIVDAVGGASPSPGSSQRLEVLERLAAGDIRLEDALEQLQG